jgi:hypothetical protein
MDNIFPLLVKIVGFSCGMPTVLKLGLLPYSTISARKYYAHPGLLTIVKLQLVDSNHLLISTISIPAKIQLNPISSFVVTLTLFTALRFVLPTETYY